MLMILKQKRCGILRGRAVADGRKQREGLRKSDVTSPTASTELVLITIEIDATEGRDVAVIDAPGASMTAYMDKEVIVIL